MVAAQTGRYSKYLRPISITSDLITITLLAAFFIPRLAVNLPVFLLFQASAWLLIALFTKFYSIYRFTTPVEILSKLMRQSVLFCS